MYFKARRSALWIVSCFVALGVLNPANATLVFKLQPDSDGNAVVSLSTFGTTVTDVSASSLLDNAGGGAVFIALDGDSFGPTFQNPPFSPSNVALNNAFTLETPLSMLFGTTNVNLQRMEFEDDTLDAFSFSFDATLPSINVSYSVTNSGFSRLLDTNNELMNGSNQPVPFADFFTGTFTDVADGDSAFLGGNGSTSDPGVQLVISPTAIPEPSAFLYGLLTCVAVCTWRRTSRSQIAA